MFGHDTSINWEDPRIIRMGSILVLVAASALVAYSIGQPHGAFGWIAIFFFGMVGALSLLALILSFGKPTR
jgi:hypothetical protein